MFGSLFVTREGSDPLDVVPLPGVRYEFSEANVVSELDVVLPVVIEASLSLASISTDASLLCLEPLRSDAGRG